MRRYLLVVVLVLAAAGAAMAQPPLPSADAPPAHDVPDVRPGRSTRVPRAWDGQPPVVPHGVRGLVPITAKANACVRCHGRKDATSGPPPAPSSHFVDMRHAPGVQGAQVTPARWNCTACHVPQTNAPPPGPAVFAAPLRR
ncbi:MAG: nitrate reductase cytochrome c-type subunit [Acidobacteria bacterium]|nr:nitrate reductase cytochrome c-type subunit [Acidobacteriota bacterium]